MIKSIVKDVEPTVWVYFENPDGLGSGPQPNYKDHYLYFKDLDKHRVLANQKIAKGECFGFMRCDCDDGIPTEDPFPMYVAYDQDGVNIWATTKLSRFVTSKGFKKEVFRIEKFMLTQHPEDK